MMFEERIRWNAHVGDRWDVQCTDTGTHDAYAVSHTLWTGEHREIVLAWDVLQWYVYNWAWLVTDDHLPAHYKINRREQDERDRNGAVPA